MFISPSRIIKLIATGIVILVTNTVAANTLADFEQQLSSYKGKIVYVDFWASWCIPCKRSFPWMNEMQNKYQDKGLTIYSVNLDADKSFALEFLKETPADFPIFYDPKGKVAKAFKLRGMPSSFIVSREGEIVSAHTGFNDNKKVKYEQEIVKLLSTANPS